MVSEKDFVLYVIKNRLTSTLRVCFYVVVVPFWWGFCRWRFGYFWRINVENLVSLKETILWKSLENDLEILKKIRRKKSSNSLKILKNSLTSIEKILCNSKKIFWGFVQENLMSLKFPIIRSSAIRTLVTHQY